MKPKDYNFRCDLDALTIFFLSEQIVSINFKLFLRSLNEFYADIKFTYEHGGIETKEKKRVIWLVFKC